MSNLKEEILAEFDKVFSIKDNVWGKAKYGGGNTIYQPSKVKQFISSALDKQHKADMEEVMGIIPEERNAPHTEPLPQYKGWSSGFNQCRKMMIDNLTTLKEKV